MGDRCNIICKFKEGRVWFYGHWSGESALDIANRLKERMAASGDDIQYAAARLVQEMVGMDNGNTGFGVWNADAKLTAGDSHGDAGVILIHSDKGYEVEILCGYHKDAVAA